MKQIKKLAAMALALPLLALSGQSQTTQAVITQGERASFYIIVGAGGARSVSISPDGRYLGGAFPSDAGAEVPGFIYDFEKDSTWITPTPANFIVSPDHYAGDGYIYRDGQTFKMESLSTSSDDYYSSTSLWAASDGLDTLFSMSYEQVEDPYDGASRQINYAYLVDGTTGKIMQKVEPHWPMSLEESNNSYGERVNACSADGLILAGHSTWPGAGSNWSPVFWDLEHDTSFFTASARFFLQPHSKVAGSSQ